MIRAFGVLVAVLALAGGAVAAGGNWYWSEAFTSNFLNQKDFCFRDGSCRDIVTSYCVGVNASISPSQPAWVWNKQHNLKLYKRLNCAFEGSNLAVWSATLIVTGQSTWSMSNFRLVSKAGAGPPLRAGRSIPPPPAATSDLYVGTGVGHWLTDKTDDGSVLILEDGSRWSVSALDQIDTSLWLVTDNITVIEQSGPYPYRLVNTDESETADAQFLGYG